MVSYTRKSLFDKLNTVANQSMRAALELAEMRRNPFVEPAHFLMTLLQLQDSDLHRLVDHFGIDHGRLHADLTRCLDRLQHGTTSSAIISSEIDRVVERAWICATLMYDSSQVRSGHLFVGMLQDDQLRPRLVAISPEFEKIRLDELTRGFGDILGASPETGLAATDGTRLAEVGGGATAAPAQMGGTEALNKYTTDLTASARAGEIDPIVGRDTEIRQLVDVLMRRRQNNPILVGEAGVGKTAVVEGLALRMAADDVPPSLRGVALRSVDLGALKAGASMRGEFEQRLKALIEEVQAAAQPIILFIDEAHTLMGAGGAAGTGDAANLLKPALARGTLRTVAATTWSEYKEHIESDPALTRRFQVIHVHEPEQDHAVDMMRAMKSVLEKHHQVDLLDSALDASVRLSARYIPARQLPDKSVSLLDTAAARVAISQHATPPEVEDYRRRMQTLQTELEIVEREGAVGADVAAREAALRAEIDETTRQSVDVEERWRQELELVQKICKQRTLLREAGGGEDRDAQIADIRALRAELAQVQGDRPLIQPEVDAPTVAAVVADWTGIPVGSMVRDEKRTLLELPALLKERIIGQDHALDTISDRIQPSRVNLKDPRKPIGVFLLAGPPGVGKTETALAMGELLYGGEQNVITINMSEFKSEHSVSTLTGAPPGYVGYKKGGRLTEAVRRKPYSVILLDEIEKAHPGVHQVFFQVFDKGWMDDSEGLRIDFKNTLILITTNVGFDEIVAVCENDDPKPTPEGLLKAIHDPLHQVFPAPLLDRMVILPYYPLSDDALRRITRLQLGRVAARLTEGHGIALGYDDAVLDVVVQRTKDARRGGRMIEAVLNNSVLPVVSREILNRSLADERLARVHITAAGGELVCRFE